MPRSKTDSLILQISEEYETEVTIWHKDWDGGLFVAEFELDYLGGDERLSYRGLGKTVAEALEGSIKSFESGLWNAVKERSSGFWLDHTHEDAGKYKRGRELLD